MQKLFRLLQGAVKAASPSLADATTEAQSVPGQRGFSLTLIAKWKMLAKLSMLEFWSHIAHGFLVSG